MICQKLTEVCSKNYTTKTEPQDKARKWVLSHAVAISRWLLVCEKRLFGLFARQ